MARISCFRFVALSTMARSVPPTDESSDLRTTYFRGWRSPRDPPVLSQSLAGVGIHRESHDLIFVLQANVQRIRHLLSSLRLLSRTLALAHSTTMLTKAKSGGRLDGGVSCSCHPFGMTHLVRHCPASGQYPIPGARSRHPLHYRGGRRRLDAPECPANALSK